MIIYSPQRSDSYVSTYQLDNDVLTITLNDVVETFDFSEFSDGLAEEITPEKLPINPIIKAERVDGTLSITVIKFYNEAQKTEYEVPYGD